jgi:hypothetical protein
MLVQSDSVMLRPVGAVFISRPVYLHGPPVATHRKSTTCWRTLFLIPGIGAETDEKAPPLAIVREMAKKVVRDGS